MQKKTPLKHTRRHILDILLKNKTPWYAEKADFVIFAENDITEVYHEVNFVTLTFLTPLTIYALSPPLGNPASC